jgi:hypothetical protein
MVCIVSFTCIKPFSLLLILIRVVFLFHIREESDLHALNIICDTDNDDFYVDFMDEEDNWRDIFLLSEREC